MGLIGGGYAARLWQRVEMVASRRVGKASAEASREGRKSEHGGIQEGGGKEAWRRARRAERASKREKCKAQEVENNKVRLLVGGSEVTRAADDKVLGALRLT